MDEFGDNEWEAQHWENAAEEEVSDEESEVVRGAIAQLQAGETELW